MSNLIYVHDVTITSLRLEYTVNYLTKQFPKVENHDMDLVPADDYIISRELDYACITAQLHSK